MLVLDEAAAGIAAGIDALDGAFAREETFIVLRQVADEAVSRQFHAAQPHRDAQLFKALGLERPWLDIGVPVAGGKPLELEAERGMDERERAAEQHGQGGVLGGDPAFRPAQHQFDQLKERLPFVGAKLLDEIDEAPQSQVADLLDFQSRTGYRAPFELHVQLAVVLVPRRGFFTKNRQQALQRTERLTARAEDGEALVEEVRDNPSAKRP